MFDWFNDKLSWVSDAISYMGGFIKDALNFIGLGDDEAQSNNIKQDKEKIINTNEFSQAKINSNNNYPSFNNGNINVNVNGTFNIATQDGNFNMNEFAAAIQKSVFNALKKQEQNKINTTIYG